jgi:nitrogen regulatory protein P-II 1
MKEIKAIIQPHMLSKVMSALHALPHFPGASVSDVSGHGRGHGSGGHYEPTLDNIYPKRKTRLEILCGDDVCDGLVKTIESAAHTGNSGDGLIWVTDVAQILRIRTGATQNEAV